jgi:hypothetical protein
MSNQFSKILTGHLLLAYLLEAALWQQKVLWTLLVRFTK